MLYKFVILLRTLVHNADGDSLSKTSKTFFYNALKNICDFILFILRHSSLL